MLREKRLATEAIVGAIFSLIYRRPHDSAPGSLPSLAPLLTYITLPPFVGTDQACRVANGDGRGRAAAPGAAEGSSSSR